MLTGISHIEVPTCHCECASRSAITPHNGTLGAPLWTQLRRHGPKLLSQLPAERALKRNLPPPTRTPQGQLNQLEPLRLDPTRSEEEN